MVITFHVDTLAQSNEELEDNIQEIIKSADSLKHIKGQMKEEEQFTKNVLEHLRLDDDTDQFDDEELEEELNQLQEEVEKEQQQKQQQK